MLLSGLIEQARHILVILIGATVAIAGARFHTCDKELFMIAATIIGGEFGLARAGTSRSSDTERKATP